MNRWRTSHRDAWLSAVCDLRIEGSAVALPDGSGVSSRRQSGAFRTVMSQLAMYADHESGAGARPSLRRLQMTSRYTHKTVRQALETAERAGYILKTGVWQPPRGGDPITIWALGYPSPEGFRPWNLKDAEVQELAPCGESAQRTQRFTLIGDSAPSKIGDSTERNNGESAQPTTTSPTSRPLGSEGGREGAPAPPPDGGARPLGVEEVQALVELILPPVAYGAGGIRCDNVDLATALNAVLARGWTPQILRQQLADMPEPRKSPTGLLIGRLQSLASTDPAAVAMAPLSERQSLERDSLAGVASSALKRFCRDTGTDEMRLRVVVDELTSAGFSIEIDLEPEGYLRMPSVVVRHPELFNTWSVMWNAVTHDGETGIFLTAAIHEADRIDPAEKLRLESMGHVTIDRNVLFIEPDSTDIDAMLRLVRETWVIVGARIEQ